jgi:hypothetical protein
MTADAELAKSRNDNMSGVWLYVYKGMLVWRNAQFLGDEGPPTFLARPAAP